MGKIKRYFFLILALELLMSVFIFHAFAADEIVGSGMCGRNVTWKLDAEGQLTISGAGAMYDHTAYAGTSFSRVADQIQRVVIGQGVTRIGEYAFFRCQNMTSAAIPDSVVSIGAHAFDQCSSLTELRMTDKVSQIGGYAFYKCSSLMGITLPKDLTRIEASTFSDCDSLIGVTIPDTVTSIGERAFFHCSSLTSVTIPGSVASLGTYAFAWCRSLAHIYFKGNAPAIADGCFWDIATTAHYPAGDDTWTEAVRQHYDGTLIWVSEVYACDHLDRELVNQKDPACISLGYTGDLVCTACGETLDTGSAIPATGHSWDTAGECTACGASNPEAGQVGNTLRLAGGHRYETAFLAADEMLKGLDADKFDTVVVASGTDFADALSGSYLAAVKKAPILLAGKTGWINEMVKDYIKKTLKPGGRVYILGGTNAIPDSFRQGLDSFQVIRLAGDNRFLTNLKVLQEAGVENKAILVCTGAGFADSLSASAVKLPILLVYGDTLIEEQKDFLNGARGNPIYIIGGTGAVSEGLEVQLIDYGSVSRVAGGNRFETSVKIGRTFFASPGSAVLAYAGDFPDGLCGGPLAVTMNAPLILTMENYEQQAMEYIQDSSISGGVILGGDKLIPDKSIKTIFQIP